MSVAERQVEPEVGTEVAGPAPRYDSLEARAETIRNLIVDGSLDPVDGLLLVLFGSERFEQVEREVEQERRAADARAIRKRFSPEKREEALSLVAGGASYRIAASVALGDERYRMSVWRWARARGLA